jgi:acetyltransferase-like isoleucine patch superfamily enzyme
VVGGSGNIICLVTANNVPLASIFIASVWRKNRKKRSHSSFGENYLSMEINAWGLRLGGDDAVLYTLGDITIGANSVVSQKCYLCTGSHDFMSQHFDITASPIVIGEKCWLATDVFVAPGVSVGDGTVVGARSSVFKSLPANKICRGNPAVVIRERVETD